MKVFIDDFNMIRVESNHYIHDIGIEGYQVYWYKNEGYNQYFKVDKPLELHVVDHIWINEVKYPLYIGLVTLTKGFDKKYQYTGKLGVIYQEKESTFKVFSPVAKEVKLVLDGDTFDMNYNQGIYEVTVPGKHHLKPYHYLVRLVDTFEKASDPYGIASNLESNVVVDLNKTYQQVENFVSLKKYTDAVIYEGHIRDLTIQLDVESKGTFLGVVEHSKHLKSNVLTYIKKLGVTHLQLLPVFDFYGVDDVQKDASYNWGYNPMQYFALEGWLSDNPNDPIRRINEFKMVIDAAHQLKLGINMDVVYNHVYERALFPYDKFVPGYFFRHDKNHQPTHSAFLENDIETTRFMVRKLIIDSLVHFVEHYKIDGFRFDLIGLMDLDTMNILREKLLEFNPNIMIYGEGWNMDNALPKALRSNMHNQALMPGVGHFNDFYRNTFKGALHTKELGYATGSHKHIEEAMLGIIGSPHMFTEPSKSLNYVECHDNLALFDTLDLNYQNEKVKKTYQDFTNHLIAISQGVPFYHAGQELYRTKKGVENSYNSPDAINKIIWKIDKSVSNFKKILKIRKKYPLYRLNHYDDKAVEIRHENGYILYTLKSKTYELVHYIKNDYKPLVINPIGKLLFNSKKTQVEHDKIVFNEPGVYIYYKKVGNIS